MPERQKQDGFKLNADGERVVGGTRRADGTIRPERKIREGYVPPDEQRTYMSRGKKWQAEVAKARCPGLDSDDEESAAGKGMSKSAKKNAARRANKASENGPAAGSAANTSASQPKARSQSRGQQVQGGTVSVAQADTLAGDLGGLAVSADATQEAVAAPAHDTDAKRKKLRNLRKKVRQTQEQAEKAASSGQANTPELDAKIANVPALQSEIAALAAEVEDA